VTVIFMACGLTLTLLFASFTATAARVSSYRTRAQIAADSAALAAAVEGTIGGSGNEKDEAVRYASLNEASVVECDCAEGSGSVKVVVEFHGVSAEAAAAVDPSRLGPAPVVAGNPGLDPRLGAAVATLVAASGGAVGIGSGFRDHAEQQRLWDEALARYGDPETADNYVARPGTSMHEKGLAVDLSGDLDEAVRIIQQLGLPLYRPMSYEPWHFELLGSRG
jgi:hypothetical protein